MSGLTGTPWPKNQMQTSADYGTSSSSGSSSTFDKRKAKKLREWVKEEPKEGEKKKPHLASKGRVLFFEEKQRGRKTASSKKSKSRKDEQGRASS